MNTIKFNNVEYEVLSYNKSTYFSGDSITSNANCAINTDNLTALNTLAEERTPITSIIIKHDGDTIYTLNDINARVDNINEYLNDDRMNINVNLVFDINTEDVL